jgi:hypothetical protein
MSAIVKKTGWGAVTSLKLALSVAMVLAGMGLSQASEPPPKKGGKEEKVEKPNGLTGAVVPRCDPGFYSAGAKCKPSPPGSYVNTGTNIVQTCPPGTNSAAASRSIKECYPPGEGPAPPAKISH